MPDRRPSIALVGALAGLAGLAAGAGIAAAAPDKSMTYVDSVVCYGTFHAIGEGAGPGDDVGPLLAYMKRARTAAFELGPRAGKTPAQIQSDIDGHAAYQRKREEAGLLDGKTALTMPLEVYADVCAKIIDRHGKAAGRR
jgi:hypothetical protein